MRAAVAGLPLDSELPGPIEEAHDRAALTRNVVLDEAAAVNRAAATEHRQVLFRRLHHDSEVNLTADDFVAGVVHRRRAEIYRMSAVDVDPGRNVSLDGARVAIAGIAAAEYVKMRTAKRREIDSALETAE